MAFKTPKELLVFKIKDARKEVVLCAKEWADARERCINSDNCGADVEDAVMWDRELTAAVGGLLRAEEEFNAYVAAHP